MEPLYNILIGQQTCDSQVTELRAGHHCVVALGKLLTLVYLWHQAV